MPRGIQEFARAVAARDGRGDRAEARPAERLDAGAHRLARLRERGGVLDRALDQPRAPHFELRLDETDEPRRASGEAQDVWQDETLRDETDVAHDGARRLAEEIGRQAARVEAFVRSDPRVGLYARVELAVADVDRDDAARAARQQHVGEAARRRPDVEAGETVGIERESVERRREFQAAARNPGMRPRSPRSRRRGRAIWKLCGRAPRPRARARPRSPPARGRGWETGPARRAGCRRVCAWRARG